MTGLTSGNADALWGMGVDETCESLSSTSDAPTGVIAIGPAGENMSVIAMAFVDRISTLGRGGFGAVMGAKNLKAIVVKGSGAIKAC